MNKISMSMLMELTPRTTRGRQVTVKKAKNAGSLDGCPHCRADANGNVLSLVWEDREQNWRCIICGYRGYVGSAQHRPEGSPSRSYKR